MSTLPLAGIALVHLFVLCNLPVGGGKAASQGMYAGARVRKATGEPRSTAFLIQSMSNLGNAAFVTRPP